MWHPFVFRMVSTALLVLLAIMVPGSAFAQPIEPKQNPTPADIEQAKKHMAAGVAFMQDPDGARYEVAYPEFKKAYENSGSLNALQNLAICAMKMELDGEAIDHFESFIDKKGDDIDEADKKQVMRDLDSLKAVVAWITVSSDKGGVTLDDVREPRSGAAVKNRYAIGIAVKKLGIHPGSHKFTARSSEGKELTWNIEVTNGGEYNHEFTFDPNAPVTAEGFTADDAKKPEEEPEDEGGGGGVHPAVWGMLAVTIASAGVMGAFMGLSATQKKKYDTEILGREPLPTQQKEADKLKTYNLVADVFIGVTGAAAVTTLILGLTLSGDSEEDEKPAARRWTVSPSFDPRGAGAMVTGSF